MRRPLQTWKLRRRWKHAQQVHAQEHEAGISRTLSCNAVGHSWSPPLSGIEGSTRIDSYSDYFDADAQRHFLQEYRGVSL